MTLSSLMNFRTPTRCNWRSFNVCEQLPPEIVGLATRGRPFTGFGILIRAWFRKCGIEFPRSFGQHCRTIIGARKDLYNLSVNYFHRTLTKILASNRRGQPQPEESNG